MLLSFLTLTFQFFFFFNIKTCLIILPNSQHCRSVRMAVLRWAYTVKFFFHELEIFILKEKCRNSSGSEMCVVKYYSVCSDNQVSFIRS